MESFKTKIKKKIFNLLPINLIKFIEQENANNHPYLKHLNLSFSQEGEDLILSQFLYGIKNGFYLDIGAHKPIQYSNTYKFYLNGWRGLNIDAMPRSMEEFNIIRSGDTNLEVGISNTRAELLYHIFKQRGINTFSKEFAKQMIEKGYELQETTIIETRRLEDILEQYLPKNQNIHFLSLDVEGFEFEVLSSNNWKKFRPKIILVESLELKTKSELTIFFKNIDYVLVGQTVNNLYFSDCNSGHINSTND